ncbi:AGE family epimerase/isomerase, partial [Vibrio aerogenes]
QYSAFSELISGYITHYDQSNKIISIQTEQGIVYKVLIDENAYAEIVHNLGDKFNNATPYLEKMLTNGRFMYAYGICYPQGKRYNLAAKHIVFSADQDNQYVFERPDWWQHQISQLADFYLDAQFANGVIDYSKYRTNLSLEGRKKGDGIQEAATLSRLVYGFATAYMMTGHDKYWQAAKKGSLYLRQHFKSEKNGNTFWYHAIDVNQHQKMVSSAFSDDYDAIPAYEQIYDLAGLVQTYRISGDPAILQDVKETLELFDQKFKDHSQKGGYFSHIDSQTFSPHAKSLGDNQNKKNWNSVGDHAPAYLINLWLATGEKKYADMLEDTFDTIVKHFPSNTQSPFVNERFDEDWHVDKTYKWQKDSAVVGHNLKIAWNLMRMNSLNAKPEYKRLAENIADKMPVYGLDKLRGGWYDVIDRELKGQEKFHRFAFHDRKAWWQQEQGILAYLILAGTTGSSDYLKLARESLSFYNAWFLDKENGGVYFNVLADGNPYLLGAERNKGSHSMSGYHAFELAYLSAVYNKLLILKQPMDLYFKPQSDGLNHALLRVQPDILPKDRVKIENVWLNGVPYHDFNPTQLTVSLPQGLHDIQVKVRLVPTNI